MDSWDPPITTWQHRTFPFSFPKPSFINHCHHPLHFHLEKSSPQSKTLENDNAVTLRHHCRSHCYHSPLLNLCLNRFLLRFTRLSLTSFSLSFLISWIFHFFKRILITLKPLHWNLQKTSPLPTQIQFSFPLSIIPNPTIFKSISIRISIPPESPEAIEALKKLRPIYCLQKMKEIGLTEEEWINFCTVRVVQLLIG